jgi:hypothetical protein
MCTIAQKLKDTTENTPQELRSFDQQEILARANYIERNVLPDVIDKLTEKLESRPWSKQIALLLYLNQGKVDARVQNTLIDAVYKDKGLTPMAMRGLVDIGDASVVDRLKALIQAYPGENNSYMRDTISGAIQNLEARKP